MVLIAGLSDLSGYAAADLHGEFVGSIGADESLGQEFKHISDLLKDWQYKAVEVGTTKHTFKVPPSSKVLALCVSASAAAMVCESRTTTCRRRIKGAWAGKGIPAGASVGKSRAAAELWARCCHR